MVKLKCHLTVKETQTASAKVLVDLLDKKDEDFNVSAVFDKALEDESVSNPPVSDGISKTDNTQDSKVEKK